jgi:hypothetical protein
MPRIDDFWIGTAVHIYRSVADAKNPEPDDIKNPRGGSGCLLIVFTERQTHEYIVTNAHVVRRGGCVPKLFHDGLVQIIDCVADDWLCHEVADDLAILPLHDNKILAHGVSDGHFLSQQHQITLGIGVGDDVFMVGRFSGQHESPVVRFGNIAAWPARKVWHPEMAKFQESILVEMRSHSGYSGSPVFVHVYPGTTRPAFFDVQTSSMRYTTMEKAALCFLGVDWGHIGDTAMAAVVPWHRVLALLHCPALKAQRAASDSMLPPAAELD